MKSTDVLTHTEQVETIGCENPNGRIAPNTTAKITRSAFDIAKEHANDEYIFH
jgi:hypothetical protein